MHVGTLLAFPPFGGCLAPRPAGTKGRYLGTSAQRKGEGVGSLYTANLGAVIGGWNGNSDLCCDGSRAAGPGVPCLGSESRPIAAAR